MFSIPRAVSIARLAALSVSFHDSISRANCRTGHSVPKYSNSARPEKIRALHIALMPCTSQPRTSSLLVEISCLPDVLTEPHPTSSKLRLSSLPRSESVLLSVPTLEARATIPHPFAFHWRPIEFPVTALRRATACPLDARSLLLSDNSQTHLLGYTRKSTTITERAPLSASSWQWVAVHWRHSMSQKECTVL
jgi:hypothetical protein